MRGFDTGADASKYAARLGGLGYRFGCRYLCAPGDWRRFTRPEAEAMAAAGIASVSVFEGGHGDTFSAALGLQHAAKAREYASLIGQPQGSAIYFAIDSDRPKASDVLAHFQAIAATGLPYEVSAYGPGALLQALVDADLVTYTWLANARSWPGYAAFKGREDILQGLPITPFKPDAFAVDPNESASDDIGQWVL